SPEGTLPSGPLPSLETRRRRSRAAGRRHACRLAVGVEELRGALRLVAVAAAIERHRVTNDLRAEVRARRVEPEQAERELVPAALEMPPLSESRRAQIACARIVERAAACEQPHRVERHEHAAVRT